MKALAIALISSLLAGIASAEVNTVTHVLLPTSEAVISTGNTTPSNRSVDPSGEYWAYASHDTSGTTPPLKCFLSFAGDFSSLLQEGYLLSAASLRIVFSLHDMRDGDGTNLYEPVWLDAGTVDWREGIDYVTGDALPEDSVFASDSGLNGAEFDVPSGLDVTKPMNFAVTFDLASHLAPPTTPEEERFVQLLLQFLQDGTNESINYSERTAPWLVLTFTKPAVKTTEAASWGEVKALYH